MLHRKTQNCLCDYCTGNRSPLVRPGCPECGSPTCAKAREHWLTCSLIVQQRNRTPKKKNLI